MQFSVYLKGTLPEVAPHRVSRNLGTSALRCGLVRQIGQNAIQIVSNMTIRDLKNYLRLTPGKPLERHKLNPPGYHCLPYTYPLPLHILRCYQRAHGKA